jgi:hypothetical protein
MTLENLILDLCQKALVLSVKTPVRFMVVKSHGHEKSQGRPEYFKLLKIFEHYEKDKDPELIFIITPEE